MSRRLNKAATSNAAEDSARWVSVFADRPKSTDPLLPFTSEVRVTWRHPVDASSSASPHVAPRLVRAEIDKAAARCDVLRPDAAEQDITAAVQEQLPLCGDGVVVTNVQIRITVEDATREAGLRAERLRQEYRRHEERIRHDHELDELARRQVRAREVFLREEVLANPAAARLYRLLEGASKHWPRLGGPPAGTDLGDLVREVQQWQPTQRWVTVAQLLHEFVGGLTEEGRKELLIILADAVRAFGDEDTAHRLALLSGEGQ
ncbi:hypothetical protein OG883_25560 [Streptomyces sp. NBC_01142]|uniref:hypothetical protein n=1 Tax=Streptomyces sp. NBC_01142 TaxID=2975865 RepID=UPI0022515BCF|nr:hypothetical protein [Streptomyces sp. NBC_01142]MCX4823194.1 hypothetical protein [Streptomyces sp. NBC_01142]